jgi:hypothetical protein
VEVERGTLHAAECPSVSPGTLSLLNPNLLAAFDEDPSKARLDVLRNRLVTGRADYPEKLQISFSAATLNTIEM